MLAILLVLFSLGALAAWGITESVLVAALITILEILGLLLVVWVGRYALPTLPDQLPEMLAGVRLGDASGVMVGAFLAFFAFIGFEDMVNVAEEVKKPRRTLPLAILLALAISTVLYLCVAVTAMLVVSPQELAASDAPLALIYTRATGRSATLLSILGAMAVVNGALIQIIMATRLLYGMGRKRWLPTGLAYIHPRRRTPVIATAFVVCVIALLALLMPLVALASTTSLILLIVFALINLALLRVKRRSANVVGAPSYPAWVPLLGFITCVVMVSFSAFFDPYRPHFLRHIARRPQRTMKWGRQVKFRPRR